MENAIAILFCISFSEFYQRTALSRKKTKFDAGYQITLKNPEMLETREVCMHANKNQDFNLNSKIAIPTAKSNQAMKVFQSHDSRSGERSGVFCCILLILFMKLVLLFTILLWRVFDIDVLDSGYNQQTNIMRFNITDYNDYHHMHHRPEN